MSRAKIAARIAARSAAGVAATIAAKPAAKSAQAQRGFSLVSAIFLLVVLAGLGAFAARINTYQQQTVTAALRGGQAFHAARSGIAWGAYQALRTGVCAPATLALTEAGTAGFRVTVSCSESTHVEGTATVRVFVLTARAEAGVYGGADYVSRRVQAKITGGA